MSNATKGASELTTFAPPPTEPATARCLNCDAPLVAPFCGACGQSAGVGRLTLRALTGEAVAQFVELDHGFAHTFIDLMRYPGQTLQGFMRGRRRKYTGPIGFVLIATALAILQLATVPSEQRVFDAHLEGNPELVKTFGPRAAGHFVQLMRMMAENKFVMDLALLIPFMLLVRWLFRKHRINLAEAGTFTAYALGASTIAAMVASLPVYLFGRASLGPTVGQTAMALTSLHLALGFFGRSFSTAWRVLMVGLLGYVIVGGSFLLIAFAWP